MAAMTALLALRGHVTMSDLSPLSNRTLFRILVAVADRQHVTQAARDLNLAQSAASHATAALETRHDTKLFDRVGRRIELTEAGRAADRIIPDVNRRYLERPSTLRHASVTSARST
jgi:DNA-binding MarR family transcriptional regulator